MAALKAASLSAPPPWKHKGDVIFLAPSQRTSLSFRAAPFHFRCFALCSSLIVGSIKQLSKNVSCASMHCVAGSCQWLRGCLPSWLSNSCCLSVGCWGTHASGLCAEHLRILQQGATQAFSPPALLDCLEAHLHLPAAFWVRPKCQWRSVSLEESKWQAQLSLLASFARACPQELVEAHLEHATLLQ